MPQGTSSPEKKLLMRPAENGPADDPDREEPELIKVPVETKAQRVALGPNDLQRQLSDFVTSAAEKGLTPSRLAKLCAQIDQLEKKYGSGYEELKAKFEETGKILDLKNKELKKLTGELTKITKKKEQLMARYELDQAQIENFADTKNALYSLGFEIEKLNELKNCLSAVKEQNYDPGEIIAKLNAIGELESKKNSLQAEVNTLSKDIRTNTKKLKEMENIQSAAKAELAQVEQATHSVAMIKDSALAQMEETKSRALASLSEVTKRASEVTESAKSELENTLSQLKSATELVSSELKDSLKDVAPQMRGVTKALEVARAMGKYEALLPLFKLTEGGESNKITETEALVALWHVASAFDAWIKNHYPGQELEISEPLEKLISSLD